MKRCMLWVTALTILLAYTASIQADITSGDIFLSKDSELENSFPKLADRTLAADENLLNQNTEMHVTPAVWPFSKDGDKVKPKSTRKAFFLSLILPGLGETYVGSKRAIAFLGIEALAWWMYTTNTNDGNDKEDEFRAFADTYWHYTDVVDSNGDPLGHNYWKWLEYKYIKDDTIGPEDYDKILDELEKNADISVHHYTGRDDQQDYEMKGKYPQFIYGWEDISGLDAEGNPLNPTLLDNEGNFNGKFDENISLIKSDLREEYENMRDDSNKKLKAGQTGIHLMIINRVVSAIDAARLAYHHNEKLESELSSVRVRMVQKHIIDHNVPMITVTKKF